MKLAFDKLGGLIPVVTQDFRTNEVLMVGFMNQNAFEETLKTLQATYWSRSKNRLWKKGETSGNVQEVKQILIDCDNDTLLLKVHQIGGAACHTGYRSCFYREMDSKQNTNIIGKKLFMEGELYGEKNKQH